MKKLSVVFFVLMAFVLASCGSTKVERVSADTQIDLSGNWNDTDVRIAAKDLIDSCLSSKAIINFPVANNGKRPVVIVGSFKNLSDEHIDTVILTKQLEAALINSGEVEFVSAKSEREEIRDERFNQLEFASPETQKALKNEIGADFIMQGSIRTIVDSDKDKFTRTYFIDAELVDIETTKKLWVGNNNSIKKIIKRSGTKF